MIRLLCFVAFSLMLSRPASTAEFMQIGGVVRTSHGDPIPGCVVRLLNPDLDASYPVSTGLTGEYFFPEVPSDVSSLYTIEVQWGRTVIFRGIVTKPGLQDPIEIKMQ